MKFKEFASRFLHFGGEGNIGTSILPRRKSKKMPQEFEFHTNKPKTQVDMNRSLPYLCIKNLHVSFKKGSQIIEVLKGIDLCMEKGSAMALVGESGSGKSITAQAIMQLLGPHGKITEGEIWLDGQPLHALKEVNMRQVRAKKIGIVFQDPMTSLNPTIQIGSQIIESLVYHDKVSKRTAKGRALELLELVGIADPHIRFKSYPFQLSGGMRQRVMIAMALACSPGLLIADEPTTALDVTVQAQILELLQDIRERNGMSLLLITHDLGIVAGTCNQVSVMHRGKIVEASSVHQLFSSPQHPYSKELLSAKNFENL